MTTSRGLIKARLALLGAATLVVAGLSLVTAPPAQAATQNFDLYAVAGSATMPGGQSVTAWAYQETATPADPFLPGGPTLTVDAGDEVNITLHNGIGEQSGLFIQGQPMVPDLTGIGDGEQQTYTFTASEPGTFLYEAAPLPNAQHQPAMGLYGALVVLPATAGQAYDDAATAYDDDEVLLLGEIDPALSNAANPAGFDMRNFAPRYFTVNGRAYPETVPVAATADTTQLIRFVNAGVGYHSMGVLGAEETVIALDGAPLTDARHYVAETIGPGQTLDALVDVPAARSVDTELLVYDAGLGLHNTNAGGTGGMLAEIPVAGDPPATDEVGPVVSGSTVAGGTLSATVNDGAGHGGSNVDAAEYYVDDVTGTGTALTGTFGTPSVDVTAAVSVPPGEHVYYLRGQDSAGNWGPFTSVLVTGADQGGPTTSGPLLTPNLVNGASSSGVDVSATADDSESGNSVIAAAEYFIDDVGPDGSGNSMDVNPSAPVASLDATIPPATLDGLNEGAHVVSIHAQDGEGNWGEVVTVNLTVDESGPLTSGVSAAPSPNNGTRAYSSSVPAVRVIATTMTDPISGSVNSPVTAAEAFIDTVGADGSGIGLTSSDGVFNDTTEGGYADIPLATVAAMSNGEHTIYVHARDAAGNWGPTATTTLVVDKTRPTVSAVTAMPNPTLGAASVTLTADATDPAPASSAIVRAEWWQGADPGVGNGAAMTVSGAGPTYTATATVPVDGLGDGDYALHVRVRDEAGNWSTVGTTTLQVRGPLFYSTSGNTNPPGVTGTPDNSDVYSWSGTAHSRSVDVTAAPYGIPGGANVDAFSRIDATQFYVSFSNFTTNVPGVGTVADEDVVLWDGGGWSMYFDGSTHGLGGAGALDIDALSVDGATMYLSTTGNTNPPGVGGAADNSDIYSWNGTSYARVFDATANGIPGGANVDGYDRVDATHFYLSFSNTSTTVAGFGAVQDEDVVFRNAGTWLTYFDGTAHGMTSGGLDVDAFDVP
ncbi:multicopper oxidase domain-containing protein [Nocardioides sp. YIM 152588]|uniref:multicopper oxidase domain-containing protein n=1 Tax=Nocardioides sp. YIM 152588 TaxID=3158259 RepID=UPI0032E45F2F